MGSINTDGQNTANINEGVTIMTASRNSQTSMEVNGHGVFTSLLIEALNGGAADVTGHISIAGVYAFIDKGFRSLGTETGIQDKCDKIYIIERSTATG